MAWRDALQPASFRGLPFFVDGHEAALGRRGVVHEYPLRDLPYVEDLGRRARVLTLEAYTLGADYMVARNRLIAAAELAGPGKLVHPWLGEMQASLVDCRLRESNAEGGICRLTLQFVESGAARFPSAEVNLSASVVASADFAAEAAAANFARRHAVAGRPAFVANASGSIFTRALDGIQGAVGLVRGAAAEVARLQAQVDTARRDLTTLIYAPASAANALLTSVRQLVRSVATAPRDALALARTLWGFGSSLPAVAPTTTSRRAQAANQAELVRLVRVLGAAEGARAAAGVQWQSFQEATQARDELVAVLDEVMLAEAVDDGLFQALRALRSAVVRDVAARGTNLARLTQWTPAATSPALALAQRLYADAGREGELVARNAVRHPLFVPGAQALEVVIDA